VICLGLNASQKDAKVARYCADHGIKKVFVLTPEKFRPAFSVEAEHIEWAQIIQYKFFYRLLQEIDGSTLIVVNECLRTQNRYDLTYNCIRHFLSQTTHQLVFQYLPIIDSPDDFMILFDLDTRSQWKREKLRAELLPHCKVEVAEVPLVLRAVSVETDAKTQAAYVREKRKLIDGIGLKDPHTIPRNLYLMSGKAKLAHVIAGAAYVGRNNRFGIDGLRTFKDEAFPPASTVFELCHNFIDFSDFLALSRQTEIDVLVADLKVDAWYFDRYQAWLQRVRDAYAVLH